MKTPILLSFLITTLSFAGSPDPLAFRDLFNGKDLSGWVDVNTSAKTWRVENGLLICTGKPIGVMRSDRQYENFILEIEWKHMTAGGNSGIFVWSEGTPNIKRKPSARLPWGVEVQMLELQWPVIHKKDPAYVSGELFGAMGLKVTPDNPRGGTK